MKLNISPKVEKFLVEKGKVDNRKIWSYAHVKAVMKIQNDLEKRYGFALVCINREHIYLYSTEFNSTEMELKYVCKLSEMQDVRIKNIFWGLRTVLSFSIGEECFKLEMDDWKRFAEIFEKK